MRLPKIGFTSFAIFENCIIVSPRVRELITLERELEDTEECKFSIEYLEHAGQQYSCDDPADKELEPGGWQLGFSACIVLVARPMTRKQDTNAASYSAASHIDPSDADASNGERKEYLPPVL